MDLGWYISQDGIFVGLCIRGINWGNIIYVNVLLILIELGINANHFRCCSGGHSYVPSGDTFGIKRTGVLVYSGNRTPYLN